MWNHIFKRIIRQPITAVAVVLFASVLTLMLCYLNNVRKEEQKSFDESYSSVPVFFKITDLDGSRVTDSKGISGWMVDFMTDSLLTPNLSPYVKELHIRTSYTDKAYRRQEVWNSDRGKYVIQEDPVVVTGISSTRVAEELTSDWGGSIQWFDGYDESILASEEFVLIVPEELKDEKEMEIRFYYSYTRDLKPFEYETIRSFKVAGYYVDSGNHRYYCPYSAIEWVYAKLGRSKIIEEIGAILNDNTKIQELRETAACWFAEPNPMGEPTPWGKFGYDYYFYAMDIDDNMLRNLDSDMKNSMRINKIASAIVFILSAGAGFLTGFLIIRTRKREIALMRTIGSSQKAIFWEFSLEQLVCLVLGILIGGGYSLWQPLWQLLIFGCVFYLGLAIALAAFLRQNLLTTIKEDE